MKIALLLTNENREIFACILLGEKFSAAKWIQSWNEANLDKVFNYSTLQLIFYAIQTWLSSFEVHNSLTVLICCNRRLRYMFSSPIFSFNSLTPNWKIKSKVINFKFRDQVINNNNFGQWFEEINTNLCLLFTN